MSSPDGHHLRSVDPSFGHTCKRKRKNKGGAERETTEGLIFVHEPTTSQSCPTDCMYQRDKAAIVIVSEQGGGAHIKQAFALAGRILTGVYLAAVVNHPNPGSYSNQVQSWQRNRDTRICVVVS